MHPTKIEIWETYNPGTIVRILACDSSGTDVDRGMTRQVRGRGPSFINFNIYIHLKIETIIYLFVKSTEKEKREGKFLFLFLFPERI